MYVCMYLCIYVSMYLRNCIVYIYIYVHVSLYKCMCMYVYIYIIYLYIYIYIQIIYKYIYIQYICTTNNIDLRTVGTLSNSAWRSLWTCAILWFQVSIHLVWLQNFVRTEVWSSPWFTRSKWFCLKIRQPKILHFP